MRSVTWAKRIWAAIAIIIGVGILLSILAAMLAPRTTTVCDATYTYCVTR